MRKYHRLIMMGTIIMLHLIIITGILYLKTKYDSYKLDTEFYHPILIILVANMIFQCIHLKKIGKK